MDLDTGGVGSARSADVFLFFCFFLVLGAVGGGGVRLLLFSEESTQSGEWE